MVGVEVAGIAAILVLITLLAMGTSIAFSLAAAGTLGIFLLQGADGAARSLAAIPFDSTSRYAWVVIPFFIFLGTVALHTQIAEDVYSLAARLLGWLPGGLGIATVASCAGFAAISGSSLATAATIGRVSIGQMRRYGYTASFASGIVAAGGTFGSMIPPSIQLVIYAILSRESVAELLVAGLIPGLISAVIYAGLIALMSMRGGNYSGRVRRRAGKAESGSTPSHVLSEAPKGGSYSAGLRAVGIIGIVFALVIAGVYEGLVTVTESAALGAIVCLVLGPVHLYLRGERRALMGKLWSAASESAATTSMMFALFIGASIFTFFVILTGFTDTFVGWVITLDLPPLMIVAFFLVMLIPLGMFLEPVSIMLIVVPILHPAVVALGFNGVWFAILTIKMMELSMITPPIGMNVFVVAGAVDDVSVEVVFRGVIPFGFADLLTLMIFLLSPGIVLWLPDLLLGG